MAKKLKKSKDVTPVILDIIKDIPNPQVFPWSYKDGSVSELTCSDVFEFVPGKLRSKFMDEVYRILPTGGKATFNVRYWNVDTSIQDYMFEWPPLSEKSFLYFNKGWREANNLKRDVICDFDFTYGYVAEPQTSARSEDVRSFNIKYYCNVIQVLQVVLTKR